MFSVTDGRSGERGHSIQNLISRVSDMGAKTLEHGLRLEKAPDILRKIAATKDIEVAALRPRLADLKAAAGATRPSLDFKAALRKQRLAVIAEIKKASPSVGVIDPAFDPERIAAAYGAAGADAVSVLTDEKYFQGSVRYLELARRKLPGTPLLRKDFIIDETQIYEARALGADSFLLIAALLDVKAMKALLALGRSLGMEALVESHDERELEASLEAGAVILGVNNRNLRTFEVDLNVALRLRALMPTGTVSVAESGIKTPDDAARLRDSGYDAILVGESLMRAGVEKCGLAIAAFHGEKS